MIGLLLNCDSTLQRLYLGANEGISGDGIVKLFECLALNSTLTSIHLNDITMSDECVKAICLSLAVNKTLVEVGLGNCGVDDYKGKLLSGALKKN